MANGYTKSTAYTPTTAGTAPNLHTNDPYLECQLDNSPCEQDGSASKFCLGYAYCKHVSFPCATAQLKSEASRAEPCLIHFHSMTHHRDCHHS